MKINFRKKIKTYWQGFLGMANELFFVVILLIFWLGLIYIIKLGFFK